MQWPFIGCDNVTLSAIKGVKNTQHFVCAQGENCKKKL